MPLYDYWCPECGKVLRDVVAPASANKKAGPRCKGCRTKTWRLPPSVGLICPTPPGCFGNDMIKRMRRSR